MDNKPLFSPYMNQLPSLPPVAPPAPAKRPLGIRYVLGDPNSTPPEKLAKMEGGWRHEGVLAKSVLNLLNGSQDSIERLAFERDPSRINDFAGIYRPKVQLIPDSLLKRVAIQDDLTAAIVHTRASHVGQFGRKQPDRHSKGFKLQVDEAVTNRMDDDQKKLVLNRVARAEKLLLSCGHPEGWTNQDRCSFGEYLYMSTRNAVTVGRSATEIIYVPDSKDPAKRKFHSFRPTDAGTIFYATANSSNNEQVRKNALQLIANMNNDKLRKEKFENDEYDWVQVIEGRPVQAFGPEEMLVHNFYPTTDIELQGYPLTPMDCAIGAITMHINITSHNKAYFGSGRASRGMLIIKSADVDADVVASVKQNFNASINGVQNAWRMPVFGIGPEDELTWQPIDSGGRDMEFQYLSDSNARTILAAFQMSPEELPGYQHLTRGTNNQALSESNNEYKLTAARDVGIRPLLTQFEDFLNTDIFPLIDAELAKICKIKLIGLDLDTEEKESVRLQQDMPVHMTFDEVLQKVEKKPVGPENCGSLPLNPTMLSYLEKYLTFGEIQERFLGVKGAAQDKSKQFYQNQMWMSWYQMQMQQQMQEQQAQQQAQQPQGPQGGGDGGQGQGQPQQGQEEQQAPQGQEQEQGGELSSGIDQAMQALGQGQGMQKSEKQLSSAKRLLKKRVDETNKRIMQSWHAEQDDLVKEITSIVKMHGPKK